MLTEGWDCNTVTHIVGLRPFMSQLLCEQVVGRGLRRRSYDLTEDGLFEEEVAKILGVPFEVVPFKQRTGPRPRRQPQHHVQALPEKAEYAIDVPARRGLPAGDPQPRRRRLGRASRPSKVDPMKIPDEVRLKATLLEQGPAVASPSRAGSATLNARRVARGDARCSSRSSRWRRR